MKILLLSPYSTNSSNIAAGIAGWTIRFVESEYVKTSNTTYIVNTGLIGKRALGQTNISLYTESYRFFKILKSLLNGLKHFKPDVVHLNSNCSNLGLIRDFAEAHILKRKKIPFMVHFRCDVSYYSYSKLSFFLLGKMCNYATKICVLNSASSEYINNKLHLQSVLLPLSISPMYVDSDKIAKINTKIRKICFVGHITKAKGFEIIKSIAYLLPDIEFNLVGPVIGTYDLDSLSSNIKMLGNQTTENVQTILLDSDLFLFPSKTEGFPNAVLEAMGSGLPIIASPVGAIPDMVGRNREGGILIYSGNPSDYAQSILELSESYDLRVKMSKRNCSEVIEKYTEEKVINKMLNLYNECILKEVIR